MIYFQQIEEDEQKWSYSLPPGANVILHIGLTSALSAPLVVQPTVSKWTGSEKPLEFVHRFDPVYTYLVPKAHRSLSLSFEVPKDVQPGDEIRARLKFASIKDCSIDIVVSVTSPIDDSSFQLFERNEEIQLPLETGSSNEGAKEEPTFTNESLMNLMKGIEGFELLPSRWLVAEIILSLCESGYEIAQEPEKQEMIRNLQRTIFFKNGTMIVAGSQMINWLSISTSISSSLRSLTGQSGKGSGRMMQHWEKWLLNMIQADIENMESKGVEVEIDERPSFDVILSKIGGAPDRLFLYFILGVMEISPRIKSVLNQVCQGVPVGEAMDDEDPTQMFADILNEKGSLQR